MNNYIRDCSIGNIIISYNKNVRKIQVLTYKTSRNAFKTKVVGETQTTASALLKREVLKNPNALYILLFN